MVVDFIDWDELTTKDKIYYYARVGYAQSKIAILVKVKPSRVCVVIRELKKEGYLEEKYDKIIKNGVTVKRKTKPILYGATDKIYPLDSKLTFLTSGVQKDHRKLIENPRLNLKCLQYPFIKPPSKEVHGHAWTNNNTTYLDYKKEFECGQVTFRIINDINLVIWVPEKVMDKRHIRGCTSKIYNEIQIYANWFQKEFECRLGLPEIYQDYHISFHEDDPLLCELVSKHGLIKIIDGDGSVIAWWDQSKGHPEFETRDERIAEARAFAPVKILWLEDKIVDLESTLSKMVVSIIEEKLVPILDDKLSSIIEEKLSNFFDNSRPLDGFEDVT